MLPSDDMKTAIYSCEMTAKQRERLLLKIASVNRAIGATISNRGVALNVIRARIAANGMLEVLAFWNGTHTDAKWENVGWSCEFFMPDGSTLS